MTLSRSTRSTANGVFPRAARWRAGRPATEFGCRRPYASTASRARRFRASRRATSPVPVACRVVTDAGRHSQARARSLPRATTRVVRGVGDYVYALNVDEKSGTQWYIYRPGKVLRSFDSNETLGYEMRYLGTARVDRFGDVGEVTRMEITAAREEILLNDLLLPAPARRTGQLRASRPGRARRRPHHLACGQRRRRRPRIHRHARPGRARRSRGRHVLAIYHPTPVIADPRLTRALTSSPGLSSQTRVIVPPTRYLNIPPERSGLLFVFRVFDKVAYALVLNALEPVVVGDLVRKP